MCVCQLHDFEKNKTWKKHLCRSDHFFTLYGIQKYERSIRKQTRRELQKYFTVTLKEQCRLKNLKNHCDTKDGLLDFFHISSDYAKKKSQRKVHKLDKKVCSIIETKFKKQ